MGYFVIPWTSSCEAAASDAALMGNLVQQMVETVVTDEAEAAQRLKKTDWPRRQLGQTLVQDFIAEEFRILCTRCGHHGLEIALHLWEMKQQASSSPCLQSLVSA